jgi:hypothetical protein
MLLAGNFCRCQLQTFAAKAHEVARSSDQAIQVLVFNCKFSPAPVLRVSTHVSAFSLNRTKGSQLIFTVIRKLPANSALGNTRNSCIQKGFL